MVRRLGLLLICAGALVGTATAARHPWDPKERFNAADQSLARSLRIQRADLGPGDWRVEPPTDNDSPLPECKNPDLSDLVLTGKAQNPNFSRNGSFVGSEGEVWATPRDAAKAWSRSLTFNFTKCLSTAMRKAFAATQGVSFTLLSSGRVPMAKLASRQFTYRISFRIKGPRATVAGRLSIYAFARGKVDASLMVMSFGRPAQPIPEALERRLATAVAQRLQR